VELNKNPFAARARISTSEISSEQIFYSCFDYLGDFVRESIVVVFRVRSFRPGCRFVAMRGRADDGNHHPDRRLRHLYEVDLSGHRAALTSRGAV
jgi:pterin-4a-carbinolamine dehydratase